MGRLLDSLRGALRSRGAQQPLDQLDAVDAAGATDMAEQVLEQAVAGAEIDPKDPDFAAVDGVDVDKYAEVCRALVDAKTKTEEEMNAIVKTQGVDPSAWKHIGETWNERMMRNEKVKMRYSATFLGR